MAIPRVQHPEEPQSALS